MYRVLLLHIIFSWLLPQVVAGQAPAISLTANRDSILIGEPVLLQLSVTGTPEQMNGFNWFDIPEKPGHFEVVEKTDVQIKEENGKLLKTQQITITGFDSGRWHIPPFVSGKYKTDSIALLVNTVPVSPLDDYRDVKEIIEISKPFNWKLISIIAGGAVLLALLTWWLIVRYFKGRKPVTPKPVTPLLSPLQEALRALQDLQARRLPAQGKFKQFYAGGDAVLKQYITRQSGITSLVNTNREMKLIVSRYRLPATVEEPLIQWFAMSDAAKFAQYLPGAAEADAQLGSLQQFIQYVNAQQGGNAA
jgi:hypothetical protein